MSDLSKNHISDRNEFFIDSGTLDPQIPSYVTRSADRDLLHRVLEGEFCYVLTARQMGKSSLMMRTAYSLAEHGVRIAIVDLTIIGTVPIEQWYRGLLTPIKNSLKLKADVSAWWREHRDLGAPQRFFDFFAEVVLHEVHAPVAIFIDEIDTTLNLDFRDDFFAVIRALYNVRANDPTFNRLTFVLLGVATPTDLMRDQNRTPFNIGSRVELREFSYDNIAPLRHGLDEFYPGQGDHILRRIFYWTNGHPYLTQRLCLVAAQRPRQDWDDDKVDQLVEAIFFAEDARSDPNLTFVQDRIQATPDPERRHMLELYEKVHRGINMPNDNRSITQNYLELFGLVRVGDRMLQVSNEIYRHVFDTSWVLANIPVDENLLPFTPEIEYRDPANSKWTAGVLISVAIAFVVVIVIFWFLTQL